MAIEPIRRYEALNSAELIRCARSDPEAFGALFDRHAPRMSQWLMGQTRDPATAADLLAETFAQAWRSCPRFRGDGEDAGAAWLYGIARNLVRHHHRTGRVETAARRRLEMPTEISDDGGIEDAEERLEASELESGLDTAYAELPPEQRRAIGYRVIDEPPRCSPSQRSSCSADRRLRPETRSA